MWMALTLLVIAGSLVWLWREMARAGFDPVLRLTFLMIWSRYAVAQLGPTATAPVAAGLSPVALVSLAAVAAGVLMFPLRIYATGRVYPFYIMVGLILFSAVLNGAIASAQDTAVMWVFAILVTLGLYRGYRIHGPGPVLWVAMVAHAAPLAMQAASVALGRAKIGNDLALNYIGAYDHEAVYSMVVLTAMVAAASHPWRRPAAGLLATAALMGAMVMANYRTMMLAAVPVALTRLALGQGGSLMATVRRNLPVAAVVLVVVGGVFAADIRERFSDVEVLADRAAELVKPPAEYTREEQNLMSARAYIWARFLYSYVLSDPAEKLIGHGPGARYGPGATHPHNDFIRFLYEYGAVGLALYVALLVWGIGAALRGGGDAHLSRATVAGYASFVVASFATSPTERIEGLILLGLLFATSCHLADERLAARAGRTGALQERPGPA